MVVILRLLHQYRANQVSCRAIDLNPVSAGSNVATMLGPDLALTTETDTTVAFEDAVVGARGSLQKTVHLYQWQHLFHDLDSKEAQHGERLLARG